MKRIRKERVEEIGLDLSKLSEDHIYRIAEITEQSIREAIDEVLRDRVIKYLLMVEVNIDDKLNVIVDLAVDSRVPPFISLESVVDRAIKRGLDRAAAYIRRIARELSQQNSSDATSTRFSA